MTWFSGSSSYCHLLTVPLTSKTFAFVWGINCYSNIVQACCRDQFGYSFSFCLFTTQFSGGRDLPEGMCVIHAGGFFKTFAIISGYSWHQGSLLDASLYSEAAFYRDVLKVPALPRADYCSLLCQSFWIYSPCLLLCSHDLIQLGSWFQ